MTTGITRAGHFVYKNELYKIAAYDYLKASKIAKHEGVPLSLVKAAYVKYNAASMNCHSISFSIQAPAM